MKLVERHIITKNKSEWKHIDKLCFMSKNLYNYSLYLIKQEFEKTGKFLYYNPLEKKLRSEKHETYISLSNNTSQQILLILDHNFRSFFQSLKRWKKDKTKFKGCPKSPKYKHKTKGRNLLVFTSQQLGKKDDGFIYFPKKSRLKPLKTKVNRNNIKQVRIVPQTSCYVIEVIYEKEVKKHENLNKNLYLSIDLGVNNLVSIISNQPGLRPILINGRIIKSVNQYYNKKKAKLQSNLENNHKRKWSKRLNSLNLKRNNKIEYYLHHTSKFIVEYCIKNNIGNVIIGKNYFWKQKVRIGNINNQNFVQIPFDKLIHYIQYKSELNGIKVKIINENYTSKCSALDLEEIKKHDNYIGQRIKRGLFKSSNSLINSDVNAALNILRKEIGNDFLNESLFNRGCVLQPVKINSLQRKQLKTI